MKMNLSNTLILKSNKGDFEQYYLDQMRLNGAHAEPYFMKTNKLAWYLLIMHIEKLKLPCCWIWYGNWKKDIHKYDNVIIFDRNYNWNIIDYIHKKNPRCRIIAWYWNPLDTIDRVPEKLRSICEEWSFDPEDCKKYSLNYNTQFSFENIVQNTTENLKYDLYFIGRDKGRAHLINKIAQCASRIKKQALFLVIKDRTSDEKKYNYFNREIPYTENIRNLNQAKCVLEITQNCQSGLTVRCVEALLLNKKVITNNPKIKEYDFYTPNNFLIIEDTIDDKLLLEFLDKEKSEPDADIKKKYEFKGWLEDFNSLKEHI